VRVSDDLTERDVPRMWASARRTDVGGRGLRPPPTSGAGRIRASAPEGPLPAPARSIIAIDPPFAESVPSL
jgi:hypothetical protein